MARQDYLFTSESVSEGHPDKVCDRISDEIVDLVYREAKKAGMNAWDVRVACETLATTNRVVIAGEVRVPDTLLKKGKDGQVAEGRRRSSGHQSSRNSSPSRARRSAPSATNRAASTGRPPRSKCCCTPSRPTSPRASTMPSDRQGEEGRRRPGHHVRLCVPRDARPHAGADLLQPQDPRAAGGRTPCRRRRRRQARPRRQEPGDGALCRRQGRRGHADRAVDPAPRRQLGLQEGPQGRRALHPRGARRPQDRRRLQLVHQPDRQIRDRRSRWRRRPHRPQDHRRHLWRRSTAWRRRVLRQGHHQGRPVGRLCGALPRQERGRRQACRTLHHPAFLRHRRRPAAVGLCRPARHRQGRRGGAGEGAARR